MASLSGSMSLSLARHYLRIVLVQQQRRALPLRRPQWRGQQRDHCWEKLADGFLFGKEHSSPLPPASIFSKLVPLEVRSLTSMCSDHHHISLSRTPHSAHSPYAIDSDHHFLTHSLSSVCLSVPSLFFSCISNQNMVECFP